MIPVSLTIQGMYSYQERQTIDFAPLLKAHLFGIFGAVGSGKSTILEAIMFALYGQIERLNKKDGQTYNMLNLKSDEFYIEFIFRAGEKHLDEYKATVTTKRNKKRFDDVKSFERIIYKKKNAGWLALEDKTAESILELSYDNFRRTIIIPQGKFQEFIQLGASERTQMLMELFNLHRFDLSGKVIAKDVQNNLDIENIKGQMLQLSEDADPEKIKIFENQLTELGNNLNTQLKKQKELTQQEIALKTLDDQFKKIEEIEKKLIDIEARKPDFEKKEKQLRQYEVCVQNFRDILKQHSENLQAQTDNEQVVHGLDEKHKAQEKQLGEVKARLTEIEPDYKKRDLYREQVTDFKRLIEIRELQDTLSKNNLKYEKLQTSLRDQDKALKNLQDKYTADGKTLKKIKTEQPDIAVLSKIQQWFTVYKHLQTDHQKAIAERDKSKKSIEELQQKKDQLIDTPLMNTVLSTDEKSLKIRQISDILGERVQEISKEIEKLDGQIQAHSGNEKLVEYVKQLKAGVACPLCGSPDHPHILKVSDVTEAKKTLLQAKQDLLKKIDVINKTSVELNKLYGFFSDAFNAQMEHDKVSISLSGQINAHKEGFIWQGYTIENEKNVEEDLKKASEITNDIRNKEKALDKLKTDIEEVLQAIEQLKKQADELKNENTGLISKKDTLLKQLQQLKEENYTEQTVKILTKEMEELTAKMISVDKEYETCTLQGTELTTSLSGLKGQLKEKQDQAQKAKQEMIKLEKELQDRTSKHLFKTLDEVKEILNWELNIEAVRKEIESFKAEHQSRKAERDMLKNQLKGKTYDPEQHQILKTQLTELNQLVAQLTEQKGSLGQTIIRLKDEMKRQAILLGELQQKHRRAENLDTLKKLFKGSGFVNYISTQYLQNLCHAANERFHKLTRQQMRLEINESNEFIVRDLLNDGHIRSVKTLSGGQTFQAAFSLALALADQVNHLAGIDQNFFFMDEGFGSLDKESLRVVFDSLKSLHKENRVVGVISHVEDMQQDMDVYLKIRKDDKRGSIVERSWE
ncbi:MAG: SMC family ATPase [Candidatus Margulisbacteria bacterium]|nr:SMC family ATPase [Candidatus Margulisiibacteriota bacterium]